MEEVSAYQFRSESATHKVAITADKFHHLCKLTSTLSILELSKNWLLILLIIFVNLEFQSTLLIFISIFVIASRQHALLILMHDGVHGRLHSSQKLNDFISVYLISSFFLFPFYTYKKFHLLHHKYANTKNDPDLAELGSFPRSSTFLYKQMLFKLIGLPGIFRRVRQWYSVIKKLPEILSVSTLRTTGLVIYILSLFLIISHFELWTAVIIFWIIPQYTVLQLLLYIRNLAEHAALANTNDLNLSRNYICNRFEKMFLAPCNVFYHLDHHLFPTVPFYNLPKLHRELNKIKPYQEHNRTNNNIFGTKKSVWNDLVGKL